MSKKRVAPLPPPKYNLPQEKEIDMQPIIRQVQNLEPLQHYRLIEQAIQYIEANVQHQPELAEIASAVGLSEYHFQRLFTRWAGISPKRFMQFLTKEQAKELLNKSENLLDTTHQIGLSSLGRLHDLFVSTEAVTPGEYKSHGAGVNIHYGIHVTPFGKCLIATTERGICNLGFIDSSEGKAIDNLVEQWKHAAMIEDYQATAPLVNRIFLDREAGSPSFDKLNPTLKLHLRGTNFQIKVWEALLNIPTGALTTYEQIATQIGNPRAVRAVGSAIGDNPIAYLIPCHRVIRKSGEFGNYLYGSARKKAILARELNINRPDRSMVDKKGNE
jgi:AraC family transcriptional regulator, regulatory protein of adaptative response / methylated-DNA-[protein]-cysteine methyltransferase